MKWLQVQEINFIINLHKSVEKQNVVNGLSFANRARVRGRNKTHIRFRENCCRIGKFHVCTKM